jgi:hypothetical protein
MMLGEQERREWERYQVVFWTIQDVARERIMAAGSGDRGDGRPP